MRALGAFAWLTFLLLFSTASPSFAFDGPSFDCSHGVRQTLAAILCSSPAAARADWELNNAYWALYTDDHEETAFVQYVNRRCELPSLETSQNHAGRIFLQGIGSALLGPNLALPSQQRVTTSHVNCVIDLYRNRASEMRSKLTGDALKEANLSPEEHIAVQEALARKGFMQNQAKKYGVNADGQFGPNTRSAINDFQRSLGAQATGFLSDDQRLSLIETPEQRQARVARSAAEDKSRQNALQGRAPASVQTPAASQAPVPTQTPAIAQAPVSPKPAASDQAPATSASKGWIGVQVQDTTPETIKAYGLAVKPDSGAVVVEPAPRGPAAKAGVLARDVITEINGNSVSGSHELTSSIQNAIPFSTIVLTLNRRGDQKKVSVVLGKDFSGPSKFSELDSLISIPKTCTLARQIGPSQMYVRDPFSGRSSPGPFCEAATECLSILTQRLPALVNFLRQHAEAMKQLNLPGEVYTALGRAAQRSFQTNSNCNSAMMELNGNLFPVSAQGNSSSAFVRVVIAGRGLLIATRSSYNADLNEYAAWMPYAKRFDHAAEFAEIEAKYEATYNESDIDAFLKISSEFRKQMEAAELFKGKLVAQSDALAVLDGQFTDLSRQANDDKIVSLLDPGVTKAIDMTKEKLSQLRKAIPADRGDVSEEIDLFSNRKTGIETQISEARKKYEARLHGFSSVDEYQKCLSEQQSLRASGITKSCTR